MTIPTGGYPILPVNLVEARDRAAYDAEIGRLHASNARLHDEWRLVNDLNDGLFEQLRGLFEQLREVKALLAKARKALKELITAVESADRHNHWNTGSVDHTLAELIKAIYRAAEVLKELDNE